MPAKSSLSTYVSRSLRAHKTLYVIALVFVAALVAWATRAVAAADASTDSTLTPAIRLAIGTMDLEGTGQAVDAASAANLLPLWKLLVQLNSSGTAAPEEISAVIDEIQLTMTAAQVKAIGAMSISKAQLASSTGPSAAFASRSNSASTSQAAAAGSDPMMGTDMSMGAAPMDGGGGMPSAGSQQITAGTARTASSTPQAIQQVIQLLQSKLQGAAQS